VPYDYVTKRFTTFLGKLTLTERQIEDGLTKYQGITSCLNAAYRGTRSVTANSFLIGAWGKDTCVRPPRDVDMYYVLPIEVYRRYEDYGNGVNKQSALLQEVKRKLLDSYPRSTIKGDGPVVLADFAGWTVEVVPAFVWNTKERSYIVCNTRNGGSYTKTTPHHEVDALDLADARNNKNTRPLIRMLKCWQANCNVPIKSFHLEILASDFLDQWPYKTNGLVFYDWMCRDFFKWMITRVNGAIFAPGTYDIMWLGDTWKTRVQSAYDRAAKACDFEHDNMEISAGDEWQKIFGTDIPRMV
jgi:hypothetical protein